jgi:hypothetical protein
VGGGKSLEAFEGDTGSQPFFSTSLWLPGSHAVNSFLHYAVLPCHRPKSNRLKKTVMETNLSSL